MREASTSNNCFVSQFLWYAVVLHEILLNLSHSTISRCRRCSGRLTDENRNSTTSRGVDDASNFTTANDLSMECTWKRISVQLSNSSCVLHLSAYRRSRVRGLLRMCTATYARAPVKRIVSVIPCSKRGLCSCCLTLDPHCSRDR